MTKAWYQRGCACRRLLEYKEAIFSIENVLKFEPTSLSGKNELKKIKNNILKYKNKEKKMFGRGSKKKISLYKCLRKERERRR